MRGDASGARPRLLIGVLAMCGVVVSLMQTIVVPLLPRLPELTGSSVANVSWLVTITMLTGAVATPVLGRTGDMYGKRLMLVLVMGAMAAGSLLCAVSSTLLPLLVGRGLQGLALAVVPLGISVIRDEVPPERLASAVAMMSTTLGIGAVAGQPTAGLVMEHWGWHTMFWICAVLGAALAALLYRAVPQPPHPRAGGRFDLVGSLGLMAGLSCFLLAVSKAGEWGASAALVLMAAAAAIGVLWTLHQRRAKDPLVNLRLAAGRPVLLVNVGTLFIGFAFYTNTLATAQLVQEPEATGYGLGVSLAASGLCLLPGGLAMILLPPVSARLSRARGPKACILLATTTITAGYLLRVCFSGELWMIILGATVVAAGTGLAHSAFPVLLMSAVPASETAASTGLNTLLRTVGQSTSSAVSAVVLSSITMRLAGGGTAPAFGAYQLVFLLAAACAAATSLAILFVPAPPAHPHPEA